jgi:hypothetical protein
MEIRKLISKFITNIFEKNYSEADKELKNLVEAKLKEKIKGASAKAKKKAKKDYDGDGKVESAEDEYKGSKNKAIKNSKFKKNFKKGNKKG